VRRLALRVALSEKLRNGNLIVLDDLSVPDPSTKKIVSLMDALELGGSSLLVTEQPGDTLRVSVRNLARVDTLAASLLSPLEAHRVGTIVITREAVETVDRLWGHRKPRPSRKTSPVQPVKTD
jgi:large subunit ribosomal protein L4